MKLIFERSRPGRGNDLLPSLDVPAAPLPEKYRRKTVPRLPELGESDLSRHYQALARRAFGLPRVMRCVMPKLQQLDPNIYEAAQDLGAPGFLAFRKVILPEIMPGVINGLLIAFTMSIDDFVISYITAGSTFSTLSMVIYSMAKKRVSPEINALSTLLIVVVVTLLVIVNVRQTRQDKRRMVHGN